jgi:hypothetical protein
MEISKSTCFVCLDTVQGDGSKKRVIRNHLIHQHYWNNLMTATNHPHIMVSTYYWRFQYVSRCLALLESSQTREEYLAGVDFLAPFDPLVFPPGYSANDTKDQNNATARLWKDEYERVVKKWCGDSKGHRFLGIKLSIDSALVASPTVILEANQSQTRGDPFSSSSARTARNPTLYETIASRSTPA